MKIKRHSLILYLILLYLDMLLEKIKKLHIRNKSSETTFFRIIKQVTS